MVAQTIPAPIGGWNRRDALDIMPPQDAVTLDNWFPAIGKVVLRKGFIEHLTGLGSGNVDTLAEYNAGTTRKLLAGANGNIYDATSSASSLKSGLSENRWQTVNFNGSMGWVNGTDTPLVFDGSSISNMTVSGSGLTVTNLYGVIVHQSRTYFWENDSQDFWYSATNALGGSLTKFPLSRVGAFGGNLVCAGSWNVAGGSEEWVGGGIGNDLAVFVMSSGDTIVYEGDDPASSWTLVGVYRIPPPLDTRGVARVGSDLVIATKGGIISMSGVASAGQLEPKGVVSDKINVEVIERSDFEGPWQLIYHPNYSLGRLLLLNVPISGVASNQFCMNADTLAWARFTDMNARSWGLYNDTIYFGTMDGKIMRADISNTDNTANITGDAETAYSYFGERGLLKRVASLRPVVASTGGISISVAPQFDFQTRELAAGELTLAPSVQSNWEDIDVNWEDWDSNWDTGDATVIAKWVGASGVGYAIGSRVKISTDEDIEWHSMTYQLEPGQGIF